MEPVVVIPAFEPSTLLCTVVESLRHARPKLPLIIVNDGSHPSTHAIFTQLEKSGIIVLHHAVNLGKGQALKTAFNYVLVYGPARCPGVVTADADGQHSTEDILALCDALRADPHPLWMGTRSFDKNVPFRSQLGNTVTRHIFRLLIGQMIHDTQSGLRGIPRDFLPTLLQIPSTRYEFELDMLVEAAKQHRTLKEIPIQTIYINHNQSSHFRPLIDSLRVYFVFLRFCMLSFITALFDFVVFSIAFFSTKNILASFLIARLLAGSFNFQNRN